MSKIIKLTPEHIAECTKEFQEKLNSGKFADGRISFSKTFGSTSRKAKLYFTELAWLKMQTLVREFDKEVAWHGVAKRGEDETKDEYYITDILVYPQEVSGASVEMDVAKYDEWIRDNFDDERFFHIGMQGHSHVKMQTNPSSVDLGHQEAILNQLTDDMFYIFVIWNKFDSKNIKIYDLAKNVLFETADVDVEVLGDFLKDAKDMVKEKTYKPTSYSYSYSKNTTMTTVTTTKQDDKKTTPVVSGNNKSNKKKGNRKKSHVYNNACDDTQCTLFDDDMTGYPYNDPFYYNGY